MAGSRGGLELYANWQIRNPTRRISSAGNGQRLIDLLFRQPIITVRLVERELDCAYATARRLAEQLEGLGLLREMTGYQRNRRYKYEPYLALFEQPSEPAGSGDQGAPVETTESGSPNE